MFHSILLASTLLTQPTAVIPEGKIALMEPVGFLALIAAMACCQIAISVRQTPGE